VFAASISKPYYLAPAFTILFPAAGVALEAWTAGRFATPARAVAFAAAALILVAAPLAKPLLSEDRYVRYAAALRVAPSTDEHHALGRLPQFFADMHGWRALAETVAEVHAALPPDDRAKACVLAGNYGEAGAIDWFGPALGLPPAISGHNSYWTWGPRGCTGEVMVIVGAEREDLVDRFAAFERGAVFRCPDCMPHEDGLEIWVARGLAVPMAEAWPAIRRFR
jgi:hypothetical protein